MQEIKIACHVDSFYEYDPKFSCDFSLSVSKAVSVLNDSIDINHNSKLKNFVEQNKDIGYIFTSKTAVYFFKHYLSHMHSQIFKNDTCFYFVGQESKTFFEKEFKNHLNNKIKIKCANRVGLKALFDEHIVEHEKHLAIFGQKNGVSQKIIESTKPNQNILILDLYELIFDQSFFEQLKIIFTNIKNVEEKKIIFLCRSGNILKFTLEGLLSYYNIPTQNDLPKNITFKALGSTAQNALIELKLTHRNNTPNDTPTS